MYYIYICIVQLSYEILKSFFVTGGTTPYLTWRGSNEINKLSELPSSSLNGDLPPAYHSLYIIHSLIILPFCATAMDRELCVS